MFGFSLTKLLVLALVVGAVIVGFRLFSRAANRPSTTGRKPDAFETEYDAETDTYVVRDKDVRRD